MNKLVNDQHPRIIDAGEGYMHVSDYTNLFVREHGNALRLVIYSKAVRRVGNHLGIKVGDIEITALSILKTWCWQNKRVDGGGWNAIVGWSGYTKAWKAKVHWGIRRCLEFGLMENKKVQGGDRLCITDKGIGVLRALDTMSEKVFQEMQDKLK